MEVDLGRSVWRPIKRAAVCLGQRPRVLLDECEDLLVEHEGPLVFLV